MSVFKINIYDGIFTGIASGLDTTIAIYLQKFFFLKQGGKGREGNRLTQVSQAIKPVWHRWFMALVNKQVRLTDWLIILLAIHSSVISTALAV